MGDVSSSTSPPTATASAAPTSGRGFDAGGSGGGGGNGMVTPDATGRGPSLSSHEAGGASAASPEAAGVNAGAGEYTGATEADTNNHHGGSSGGGSGGGPAAEEGWGGAPVAPVPSGGHADGGQRWEDRPSPGWGTGAGVGAGVPAGEVETGGSEVAAVQVSCTQGPPRVSVPCLRILFSRRGYAPPAHDTPSNQRFFESRLSCVRGGSRCRGSSIPGRSFVVEVCTEDETRKNKTPRRNHETVSCLRVRRGRETGRKRRTRRWSRSGPLSPPPRRR